jgi:hypothetical protein
MRIVSIATVLLFLTGCDASPPLVQQDVRDFLQRRQDCQHWAGEEGYDAARRAEIDAAYAKLRCAALGADEDALKRRYGGNPALVRTLDAAKKQQP